MMKKRRKTYQNIQKKINIFKFLFLKELIMRSWFHFLKIIKKNKIFKYWKTKKECKNIILTKHFKFVCKYLKLKRKKLNKYIKYKYLMEFCVFFILIS